VEKDEYLKVLSAYIHLNPVHARIVTEPAIYGYSSYCFYSAKIKPPAFLRTMDLLGMFKGDRSEYKRFVASYIQKGIEVAPDEIYGKNSLLGSEGF